MARVMVFVDGTWLYMNMPRLAETYGKPDYKIDLWFISQSSRR